MINEKEFLKICNEKGLKAFKVTTELDDADIQLDSDELDTFFEVCKCYDVGCVFYSYIQQTKEMYELDREKLVKHIEEFVNRDIIRVRYNPFGFDDDAIDVDVLVEKYEQKIDTIIKKQDKVFDDYKWGKPMLLEVFMTAHGDRIGITLFNDELQSENELIWKSSVIEELDRELEADIASMYEEYSRAKSEKYEKERQERERKHDAAVDEIKDLLVTSDKLMKCTNGKLRHAYAKELTDEFCEKYDCYLTIGEVDVLVESEYKSRK